MLRSDYCNLSNQSERALCDLGECPYDQVSLRAGVSNVAINGRRCCCLSHALDGTITGVGTLARLSLAFLPLPTFRHSPFLKRQGGYFVINGSEKVLIAQVSEALQGRAGGGASPRVQQAVNAVRKDCGRAGWFCIHSIETASRQHQTQQAVDDLYTSTAPLPVLQERMANNHVYVFRKSQPSKYAYVAECRCGAGSWEGGRGRRLQACRVLRGGTAADEQFGVSGC